MINNSRAEINKPFIINGDLSADDRGELMFVNILSELCYKFV